MNSIFEDEDTVMADELLNQTMKCVDMVRSALDGSGENEYIEALQVADSEIAKE